MSDLPKGFHRLPSGRIQWRTKVNGRFLKGSADTLAQARVDRARAQLDAGANVVDEGTNPMTVAELLAAEADRAERAETTKARRAAALAQVPDTFLARPASTVDARVVDQLWRQMLAAEVGRHSIVKASHALSSAWKLGIAWGVVTKNPFRDVPAPRPSASDRVQPPTPEQVGQLVEAACDTPWLATWIKVAAVAGTRPGELCALRWEHVDANRSRISIVGSVDVSGNITVGKIGARGHRDIDLPLPVMRALTQLARTGEWVFDLEGSPRRPQSVRQELHRACERARVERINPYALRHFAASQAIAAGVPIPEVAAMLGDNPATVMRTYAHFIPRESSASSAVAEALGWG